MKYHELSRENAPPYALATIICIVASFGSSLQYIKFKWGKPTSSYLFLLEDGSKFIAPDYVLLGDSDTV